ncbi:MAG: ribulokinase, partial [Varibaculum cambriense]|nr:ribulokinase [Varibaculum cambriense]
MENKYVIGIDFGTLSGRAVVVRVSDGEVLASAVTEYAHGVMDTTLTAGDGQALPPEFALEVPADYIA